MATYRPRKHHGFSPGAPRIAPIESSGHYGNGRRGVWNPEYPDHLVKKWTRQGMRGDRQKPVGLIMPMPNGFNDPISIALVVDLLLRIEYGTFLNSALLSEMLQREFPHIIWDPVTVGRIMKALVEESFDRRPPNGGQPPIEEIRLSDGRVYMLHLDNPYHHAWLAKVREHFGKLAEAAVKAANEGERPVRDGQVWADVTTIQWGSKPE